MQIVIAIIIVGISFLALGFNIFFRHGKKFPDHEIGRNKKMRELGISCAKCDENRRWSEMNSKRSFRIKPKELKIDTGNL